MDYDNSCAICLDIADKAVETSCCRQLFCQTCLCRVVGKECPMCRQEFEVVVNDKAREIIGKMEAQCGHAGCWLLLTRSTVQDHERACKFRIFKCPAPSCTFQGPRGSYASHLSTVHEEEVLERSHYVFNEALKLPGQGNESFAIRMNDAGKQARLGSTGKFYCGASLGEPQCFCCDGFCGPTAGCNCKSCMKLDVASRGLHPNWYVNGDGAACRKSDVTGLFHCGRKLRMGCDEYCGPSTGPSCGACQKMLELYETRYAEIWQSPLQ